MTDVPGTALPSTADSAGGESHADAQARLRRAHQRIIDAEMRASRRLLLDAFRLRLRVDPDTLVAEQFLGVADRQVVRTAIIIAASGLADACDLQISVPHTSGWRIARHHRLPRDFLAYFATVDATVPSACGTALATGDPVLIDDITASPIFAGQPTLAVMLAAGTRSVHSYPLHDDRGSVLAILSLHYRTAGRHPGQERLARSAAQAMANLDQPTAPQVTGLSLPLVRPSARSFPDPVTADVTATHTTEMIVVTVRGVLDAVTAADCARHLQRATAALAAHQMLVIDLREVDHLAAAGVRTLIDAAHACTVRGVPCHLLAAPGHLTRTMIARLAPNPPLQIVEDLSHLRAPENTP